MHLDWPSPKSARWKRGLRGHGFNEGSFCLYTVTKISKNLFQMSSYLGIYFRKFKYWRLVYGFHEAGVQFICMVTDKQSSCNIRSFWYKKHQKRKIPMFIWSLSSKCGTGIDVSRKKRYWIPISFWSMLFL